MFSTFHTTAISAAALALAQLTSPAQAAYVVTLEEVPAGGGITNVVGTGSGSIDLTDLSSAGTHQRGGSAAINPGTGIIKLGTGTIVDSYTGFTGPLLFGSFLGTFPSSFSGLFVAILGDFSDIQLPDNYTSGTSLGTSTDTWNGATIASLGAIPGTYTWHWGTGANADSFTLNIIAPSAAPEPASLALLAMGLAGLGMVVRTRRSLSALRTPSRQKNHHGGDEVLYIPQHSSQFERRPPPCRNQQR